MAKFSIAPPQIGQDRRRGSAASAGRVVLMYTTIICTEEAPSYGTGAQPRQKPGRLGGGENRRTRLTEIVTLCNALINLEYAASE
jgi:hypothetical protein